MNSSRKKPSLSFLLLFLHTLPFHPAAAGVKVPVWNPMENERHRALPLSVREQQRIVSSPRGFVNLASPCKALFRCLTIRRESDDCIEQQKRGNFLLTSMPVSPPLITKELVRKSEAFWRFYDSSSVPCCSSEIDSVSLNSCPQAVQSSKKWFAKHI